MTSKASSSGFGYAIDQIGAKRVVIDTIEAIFGGLTNTGILPLGTAPPFRLAQGQRVTAVITGEGGTEFPDAPGSGGIRLGLRHPAGSHTRGADFDPPAAGVGLDVRPLVAAEKNHDFIQGRDRHLAKYLDHSAEAI